MRYPEISDWTEAARLASSPIRVWFPAAFLMFGEEVLMSTVEKSIEVEAPIRVVYNQWTQFEEFPRFMEGVKAVRQLDDKRLHWRAEIAGQDVEWDAIITEQMVEKYIGWRSTEGAHNAGTVSFEALGPNRTRVTVRMEYEPEGAMQTIGDWLGAFTSRVEGDLRRFKEFIEARGIETGGWRGEIVAEEVVKK
jgi:uncharacterized membrane protein